MSRHDSPSPAPAPNSGRTGRGLRPAIFGRTEVFLPVLIVLFTLPVSLKALQSYFTFDDLMNLHYYLERPWTAIVSNLAVFTSFRRPLGALVYLPLFGLAGMNPEPYYLAGILLYSINIVLAFHLAFRISGNRLTAFLAASLFGLHPEVHNVLFNFGAVYELLCLLFLLTSAILYLRFNEAPEPRPGRLYLLSMVSFLAALNAKETAAAFPAVLAAFHLFCTRDLFEGRRRLRRVGLQLLPFFVLVVPYTAAKMLGSEAYWRENAQYSYHLDGNIFTNLARYLEFLSNQELAFSAASAIALLAGAALLALALRSRPALFGLAWALAGLLPVLPLPRVWGLFLYIPLFGFALATGAMLSELGRLSRFLPDRFSAWRPGRLAVLVLASLFLFRLLGAMAPDIDRARRNFYHERNPSWRSFAEQLYSLYPELPAGTLLVFENPPFDRESHERWCLNFLVWLKYGSDIRVARVPDDSPRIPTLAQRAAEVHRLTWDGRRLK